MRTSGITRQTFYHRMIRKLRFLRLVVSGAAVAILLVEYLFPDLGVAGVASIGVAAAVATGVLKINHIA